MLASRCSTTPFRSVGRNWTGTTAAISRRHFNMATVAASVAASGSAPAADSWTAQDQRRMLHVVFRVGDLKKSIEFYKTLGMDLLRERDVPDEKYTNAFLGFGPETSNFAIELTYNYGVESYELGDAFGHFAVATTDVKALVEKVRAAGGKVSREPGPVKGGTSKTIIAFVEDPTGYKWELIERSKPSGEPLAQVMLRVGDLEKSTSWYRDVLGMTVLRTRDNPDQKYTLGFAGYGPEEDNTVVELTYNYGRSSYENRGNAYGQIALSTNDVYKTAEAVRAAGGKVTKEPGPLPGLGTKIMACTDPDGWKYVFVDNKDFLAELK